MIEAELVAQHDDGPDRSRMLLSRADRERLERVLGLLPSALRGLSSRRVAEVLVEGACLLANARVGWVVLPDFLPEPVVGGPDARSVVPGTEPGSWPAVACALDGDPVHVADLSAPAASTWTTGAGGAVPQPVATTDGRPLRTLSAVPIRGADLRGALVLAHHRADALSDRQLALVDVLTEHLGHVLGLCEAVAEKTRIASALQETLLPPLLPDIEDVEIAARYRPSGSGNVVGGDFYDVFTDGRSGWYVLLGDASGIGPEAAGLAGVARYTARALAETATGPAEILSSVNRALLRAAPDDRFCTAVLAHLGLDADRMLTVSLASGGHPPAIVQRSGGQVLMASSSTGALLGVLADAPIGETAFSLGPGDAVAFYTDGVVEARSTDREQFGEDRLVAVVAEAHGRSAAGTARRVERAVVDFRSPQDQDDMAIVVVRRRPMS